MAKVGYLTYLEINGFRSIESTSLALKPLNVLIGPNGAGKSNFINFFRFMNKLLQKDLQLYVAEQGGQMHFCTLAASRRPRYLRIYVLTPTAMAQR
ncbi:AAA family ATPase [Halomonas sp. HAL1]|uniref:AAA family ATPase n=1 Tax=Halomonas sp. HAL1 TaxID=550984 RepID=UPI00031396E1|nr:AAA family ATPase [Halomonas sp. HAL1]WKV94176.1 AAA family ATPase [Halomonas sp. HAL1]